MRLLSSWVCTLLLLPYTNLLSTMNTRRKFKSLITGLMLLAGTAMLTSCNRGYGCPNNLSVDVSAAVQQLPAVAAKVLD